MTEDSLLREGKMLPLMEAFYTLQGEGAHTGKPAWFIRIGGCDVGCHWCDVKESWDASLHPLTLTDDIVAQAVSCQAKMVVITGGEPLLYNLDYLCNRLHEAGCKTFLETSGSETLSGTWDWICLSPKRNVPPLSENIAFANELKVIIQQPEDFDFAEKYAASVSKDCKLLLQPEWSKYQKNIQMIVDYILQHPQWSISIQAHKFMHIP